MTENQRRIVEKAFRVTVDHDGHEHHERLPGTSTRVISRANDALRQRERLLFRLVEQAPDPNAFPVYHLLAINKASPLEVAQRASRSKSI